MNVNKLPTLFCKFHSSYFLRKTHFSRVYKRNFHLGSNFCSDLQENGNSEIQKDSELIFTGVEHLQMLKSVSKKNNKLSIVEEKDKPVVESLKARNIYYPYKGPEDRIRNILVEDGKIGLRKTFKFFTQVELGNLEHAYFSRHTDILIIGAGATGLLIAHALKSQVPHGPEITVVDKLDCFPRSTITLGQGLVTCQLFSEEEEIPILQYGAEFLSSFKRTTAVDEKPEFTLPYDPMGSLVLATNKNADEVLKRNEVLKGYGIKTKILNTTILKKKFPWLNTDDVLFASLGMCNEGTIHPWSFLYGIYCKTLNLGVKFVKAEVIDFGNDENDMLRVVCKLPDGTYNSIDYAYCIIAGGIESLNLVNLFNQSSLFNIGLNLPLEERMKYEYCFYAPNGPGINTPIVFNSDDTYFRREGLTGHYVAGVPSVVDEQNTPYEVFESKIRPFLMKRLCQVKKFELVKGWTDTYDYCFSNKIGITGPHPETNRIVFALGFSQHGLLLLPGLARAVMEFVLYDEYKAIDFTPFHIENLWKKQHLEAERKRKELLEAEKRTTLADPVKEKTKIEALSG